MISEGRPGQPPDSLHSNETSRKERVSPENIMNSKKGWKAGALFLLVTFCFAMFWYLHVDTYIPRLVCTTRTGVSLKDWDLEQTMVVRLQRTMPQLRTYESVREMCYPGDVSSKAVTLISNYSRDHPVFLQMSDYFWVKNQSFYQLPYGTKGSEDILMKFLALTSRYHVPPDIKRLSCRRCVVVGNGHRLRNSSLGDVINKYDVVIRLNNAPVHKYQKDVGNKTTMRFFYPESADFDLHLDNNPDSLMVLVPFKPLDIQWMKVLLSNEKRVNKGFWKIPPILWEGDPQNIRILNPYYMEVTASKILGCDESQLKKLKPKPTTGMLAITFALHFCDLVHIAGFGYPASSNKKQPIHYYETVTLKSMAVSGHNITLEAVAIKQLLQHRLIHNLTYF